MEIVKLKKTVCSKEKEIENLEKLVKENEGRLDDLIDLRGQVESMDNEIRSIERQNSDKMEKPKRATY